MTLVFFRHDISVFHMTSTFRNISVFQTRHLHNDISLFQTSTFIKTVYFTLHLHIWHQCFSDKTFTGMTSVFSRHDIHIDDCSVFHMTSTFMTSVFFFRHDIYIHDISVSDMTSTLMTSVYFTWHLHLWHQCFSDMTSTLWHQCFSDMIFYIYNISLFRHDIHIYDISVFSDMTSVYLTCYLHLWHQCYFFMSLPLSSWDI